MENIFEGCKVGTELWSSQYGPVLVEMVTAKFIYVNREGNQHCYYLDGRFYSTPDVPQSLFWGEPKIIAPEKPKPEPCDACKIKQGGAGPTITFLLKQHCTCEGNESYERMRWVCDNHPLAKGTAK